MADVPSNSGHRSRLRRRFLDNGLGALHDHEALELLLTYAIPRRDVKPLAKALLREFGSFDAVFDATEYELGRVPGIGENAAALILLNKAICIHYLAQKLKPSATDDALTEPRRIADFVRMKIGGNGKETLLAIFLNKRKIPVGFYSLPGTVDRAIVYPREILQRALELKATAVVLAHNHPSGICEPSGDDEVFTRQVREALTAAGVEFVDHLIVSPAVAYSWRFKCYVQ